MFFSKLPEVGLLFFFFIPLGTTLATFHIAWHSPKFSHVGDGGDPTDVLTLLKQSFEVFLDRETLHLMVFGSWSGLVARHYFRIA